MIPPWATPPGTPPPGTAAPDASAAPAGLPTPWEPDEALDYARQRVAQDPTLRSDPGKRATVDRFIQTNVPGAKSYEDALQNASGSPGNWLRSLFSGATSGVGPMAVNAIRASVPNPNRQNLARGGFTGASPSVTDPTQFAALQDETARRAAVFHAAHPMAEFGEMGAGLAPWLLAGPESEAPSLGRTLFKGGAIGAAQGGATAVGGDNPTPSNILRSTAAGAVGGAGANMVGQWLLGAHADPGARLWEGLESSKLPESGAPRGLPSVEAGAARMGARPGTVPADWTPQLRAMAHTAVQGSPEAFAELEPQMLRRNQGMARRMLGDVADISGAGTIHPEIAEAIRQGNIDGALDHFNPYYDALRKTAPNLGKVPELPQALQEAQRRGLIRGGLQRDVNRAVQSGKFEDWNQVRMGLREETGNAYNAKNAARTVDAPYLQRATEGVEGALSAHVPGFADLQSQYSQVARLRPVVSALADAQTNRNVATSFAFAGPNEQRVLSRALGGDPQANEFINRANLEHQMHATGRIFGGSDTFRRLVASNEENVPTEYMRFTPEGMTGRMIERLPILRPGAKAANNARALAPILLKQNQSVADVLERARALTRAHSLTPLAPAAAGSAAASLNLLSTPPQ